MSNPSDLIEQNTKLVYYIISHEYPTYLHDDDLVQAGMLGLCEAANRWDETKSNFGTFAGNWIRGEIKKEFVSRKKNSGVWSTDRMMGGDDRNTRQPHEQMVFDLRNEGLNTDEIALKTGRNIQTIQRITRNIRRKCAKEDEYGYSYVRSAHPGQIST